MITFSCTGRPRKRKVARTRLFETRGGSPNRRGQRKSLEMKREEIQDGKKVGLVPVILVEGRGKNS